MATAMRKVPTLSLAGYTQGNANQKQSFVDQLFFGLKEYGFIVLRDHPIAAELLNQAYHLSEQLFQLPDDVKKSYVSTAGGGQRGYTPFGVEHAKDSGVADLKEFWHVGRDVAPDHLFAQSYPNNIWPQELPEFQTVFQKIYQSLDQCGEIILEALTGPLEVPSEYFAKMVKDGNSILRLLHYPPLPADRDPNSLRAAPHEDINLITILVSASASGLQLKDRDGQWLDIESEPNDLIVDAGDMLSRITNEVIPATTHQVINPDNENSHRYSMPYFVHPNPIANLECIDSCRGDGEKYPPIKAEDFLQQRLREIGLT